jgi:ATP-dependent RNA helicase DeaD
MIGTTEILSKLGISAMNSMQEKAFSGIEKNKQVKLLAPTGSGKTLAFLLPLAAQLTPHTKGVQAMVLAPTRELALQIESVWRKMGTGYKASVFYGGHAMQVEKASLSEPPALIIGTPGRIADHFSRKTFDASNVQCLVMDEFDKSLEMGFHEQIEAIVRALPRQRKTVLVSATAHIDIPDFMHFQDPVEINFLNDTAHTVRLQLKVVHAEDRYKMRRLFDLLCSFQGEPAIVFFNHREAVEEAHQSLKKLGLHGAYYHGGLEQDERERALIHFRNGTKPYLFTTDIAARGLDIPEMNHVVHYQMPLKEAEFVHRNGRTARMKATGTVYIIHGSADNKRPYLPSNVRELDLPKNIPLPAEPEFETIYISGGKKDKLSKIDIVGFFGQKGQLAKEDIGLISVHDFYSYVAVRKSKTNKLLQQVKEEKMKGKKFKLGIAP